MGSINIWRASIWRASREYTQRALKQVKAPLNQSNRERISLSTAPPSTLVLPGILEPSASSCHPTSCYPPSRFAALLPSPVSLFSHDPSTPSPSPGCLVIPPLPLPSDPPRPPLSPPRLHGSCLPRLHGCGCAVPLQHVLHIW